MEAIARQKALAAVIFCDTSAIYALADPLDLRHREARDLLEEAVKAGERFVTHNYVLVEALAVLQRRLGHTAAALFARSVSAFDIVWVEPEIHQKAVAKFLERARRQVSFVDEVSFLVMKSRDIETAFCFDPDFEREGFRLLKTKGA